MSIVVSKNIQAIRDLVLVACTNDPDGIRKVKTIDILEYAHGLCSVTDELSEEHIDFTAVSMLIGTLIDWNKMGNFSTGLSGIADQVFALLDALYEIVQANEECAA